MRVSRIVIAIALLLPIAFVSGTAYGSNQDEGIGAAEVGPADPDDWTAYTGAECRAVDHAKAKHLRTYISRVTNRSATETVTVTCPVARTIVTGSAGFEARIYVDRGDVTTKPLKCIARSFEFNGPAIETAGPVKTTVDGPIQLASLTVSETDSTGGAIGVRCHLPPKSSIIWIGIRENDPAS